MSKVLVFIDQFKGSAQPASWEALAEGRKLAEQLGGDVTALAIGEGAQAVARQAFAYGAEQAFYSEEASLQDYRPEPYASLLTQVAKEQDPDIILLPTTVRGRELAGMIAIDLNTGVLADVTGMELQDGKVEVLRPIYAGKILSTAELETRPQIITTRGRAFEKPVPDESRSGEPQEVSPSVSEDQIATKVIEYAEAGGGVSLSDSGVIVSGGRGVANNPELEPPAGMSEDEAEIWRAHQGFELVKDLARVLDAAVGASRAAVDAGYIPYSHQVGQTGKVVNPDLYIAAGISGAIQHLAGMRNSKVIVAINKDPDAPIFQYSRFGVVGDLYKILPPLTEALRERLGK